jgi:hypothetical protein
MDWKNNIREGNSTPKIGQWDLKSTICVIQSETTRLVLYVLHITYVICNTYAPRNKFTST